MASGLSSIAPAPSRSWERTSLVAAPWAKWLRRAAPIVLIVAVLAVFGQVVQHDLLLWDDNVNITRNPHFAPRVTSESVAHFWREPYVGLYVPVTYTVLAGELWLAERVPPARPGKPAAWVFHAGNVLLHLTCAWLVFGLIRQVLNGRDSTADATWPALAGALLFAVHPLQVEAVAWATEVKTLVASLLGVAAVRLYLASAVRAAQPARRWVTVAILYLLASVFFALALLAKPIVVVLPVVALVLEWVVAGRVNWRPALALAPWVGLAVATAWNNKALQPDASLVYVPALIARPQIAADALAFYAAKLAVPWGLAIDPGRHPRAVLAGSPWPAVGAVIGMVVALVALRRRPLGLAALALAVVALAPTLGLVPFEFQNVSTVADRYAYLALLGVGLGWAALLHGLPRAGAMLWPTAVAGSLIMAGLSYRQAACWATDESLYRQALAINGDSHQAHGNLAAVLLARGETRAAEQHYREALRVAACDKSRVTSLTNLASALLHQQRYDEAETALREALAIKPHRAQTLSTLASVQTARGEHAQAAATISEVLTRNPDRANFWIQLGSIELARRRFDKAEAALLNALALRPEWATALRGLAQVATERGEVDEALKYLKRACQVAPDDWQPHYDAGRLFFAQKRFAEAAGSFQAAAMLNPQSAGIYNNLASALVKLNRLPEAAACYRKAIELDSELVDARRNLRQIEPHLGK